MINIVIKTAQGDNLEVKNVTSEELLKELKELKNTERIDINKYRISNDIFKNFAMVYLEHMEKTTARESVNVEYKTFEGLTVDFEIDFYDIFATRTNDIIINNILKFSCDKLAEVMVFDNQLIVVFKDQSKLCFN